MSQTSVAFIPNAKDYFVQRARDYVLGERIQSFKALGLEVTSVDLRDFSNGASLKSHLAEHDLIWVMSGNTFMLRYEMRRSGFEAIIGDLLSAGIVYGGDSAGALVAGESIGGINLESADTPEFAEEVIEDGLGLVPYVIVPHVDNPEFAEVMKVVEQRPDRAEKLIELKDSQAVVFDDYRHRIVRTVK